MEGSLRTPCIARWPGKIAAGRTSNEIVHITDWFTFSKQWRPSEVELIH